MNNNKSIKEIAIDIKNRLKKKKNDYICGVENLKMLVAAVVHLKTTFIDLMYDLRMYLMRRRLKGVRNSKNT
jgi:hypothetical protein